MSQAITVLVFQNKRKEEFLVNLPDLREAQHLYSTASAVGSLYYIMEKAIRLITLRYSGHTHALMECGYAIVEKSSEGGRHNYLHNSGRAIAVPVRILGLG